MNQSVQALEQQSEWLRSNLHELEARCKTEDDRNDLRKAVAQSRDNYFAAANAALRDDDADVAALTGQMKNIHVALDKEVKEFGDFAKVLNMINKAVDIGSQIAAKAVAL